jgi:hypothetical protein
MQVLILIFPKYSMSYVAYISSEDGVLSLPSDTGINSSDLSLYILE